jgi:hypothetical protein
MARSIKEDAGCDTFVDLFDVKKGDRIEERIAAELPHCDELVVLLTPWSVRRNWVWTEVGAAWVLRKRVVGVLYGVSIADVDREYGGMASLAPTNCIALDEFDAYLLELKDRARG